MSLASQIGLLATRVGTEIKSVKASVASVLGGFTITSLDNGGVAEPILYNPNTANGGSSAPVRIGNTNGQLRIMPYPDGNTYVQSTQTGLHFTALNGAPGIDLTFIYNTATFTGEGVFQGPVTLPGDPVNTTHAATKSYVDSKIPALGTNFSSSEPATIASATRTFTAANGMFFVPVRIPVATTLTGIRIRKGTGTTAGNLIGALYTSAGTRVAVSGTVAHGTTASAVVTLPFSAAYAAAAGSYWVGVIGSATTSDFYGWAAADYLGPASYAAQGSFATPASFTPVANTALTSVVVPMVSTY